MPGLLSYEKLLVRCYADGKLMLGQAPVFSAKDFAKNENNKLALQHSAANVQQLP